jgi:hypothetical protein
LPTIVQQLELSGNPFEHYTAETEPHITEYAVRPPYLEAIAARVSGLSSFILFGDRGAGKSATRITVFNQIWAPGQQAGREPLVVNFTDFQTILPALKRGALADSDIIEAVSFVVIEQILLWLAALPDDDREVTLEVLNTSEKRLAHQLMSEFYLPRPELERQFRSEEAFRLLNSALIAKSAIWLTQRWDAVSAVLASIASIFSKHSTEGEIDAGPAAQSLLQSLKGAEPNAGRAVLARLVQLAKIFGFTGVSVLVDKVDETELTTNSAELTSKLIYPLVAHIQLLEVPGFSWQFFLWSKVKGYFEDEGHAVRLDKIANSSIAWNADEFRLMLDRRIKYFSGDRHDFASLFHDSSMADGAFSTICTIAMGSPRELVKILDVIVREHDVRNASGHTRLLTVESIELGLDKYVKDVISAVYTERVLGQIYRIKRSRFVNRDVQSAFRVSDQSARAKIKAWEDAGLVKYVGTRAAEGDLGGKPSSEYAIADARIERIMRRQLVEVEDDDFGTMLDINAEPIVR